MEKDIITDELKKFKASQPSLQTPKQQEQDLEKKMLEERRLMYRCMANSLIGSQDQIEIKEENKKEGTANSESDDNRENNTNGQLIINDWIEQAKHYKNVPTENKRMRPVNALTTLNHIETCIDGRVASFSLETSKNVKGEDVILVHLKRFIGNHETELVNEQTKCLENGEQLINMIQKVVWKFIETS